MLSEFTSPAELFGTIAMFVVVGIMAVFLGVYFWGTRYNKLLINRFGAILKTELGPKCEKSKMQIFRTSGFRLICQTKGDIPLKNWEVVLFLLNRENLIHHIISKFRPHYDMLLTSANFLSNPRLHLEIINTMSKDITKEEERLLKDLKTVDAPKMNKKYIVKTSEPERVESLFQDDEFIKMINKLNDDFVRISITDKTPHLLFSTKAKESTLITHVRLAEKIGNYFKPLRRKPKILE